MEKTVKSWHGWYSWRSQEDKKLAGSMKLTPGQLEELAEAIRQYVNEKQAVDEEVAEIEATIEGYKETAEKLTEVVRVYVPGKDGGEIVVQSLADWIATASRAMIGERRLARHALQPYEGAELEQLTDAEQTDMLVPRADISGLIAPVSETATTLEPQNTFPTMTHALLIAVIGLLLCLIILAAR
jgi:hypothetical protein